MNYPKSFEALMTASYSFDDHRDYGANYWAVNTQHAIYIKNAGNIRKILEETSKMAAEGLPVPTDLLWSRVKNPEDYGPECYYPISAFQRRDEWKLTSRGVKYRVLSWDRMLSKEKLAKAGETRDVYRGNNMPFFRMFMTGDPNGRIHCPIMKFTIDEYEFHGKTVNHRFQQHHIPYQEGTSLNKEGEDPGRNNCTTNLMVVSPKSTKVLLDTAGTIFVSATAHDMIHKHSTSGDITKYETHELPYSLQNEANWEEWREYCRSWGYDIFPSFDEWTETLTLSYYLSHLKAA
jgi:hypothetical protein